MANDRGALAQRAVAALFALHPLRVESVAWVAERRDVLSGLFFMLTLGAYGEYVRHPQSLGRYLAVVGLFALGLMAKPMLVTLPPLLLLLDFWPLGRFRRTPDTAHRRLQETMADRAAGAVSLALNRGQAAAFGIGYRRGRRDDAHPQSDARSPHVARAIGQCGRFVRRLSGATLRPGGTVDFLFLSRGGLAGWQVAGAVALLLAITAAAVIGRRSYPYFFVGWFWYVGMLVPVIGLTFVGAHARADRYTYLSQIGLYIALVWGAMRLGASWPARRWVFGVGSALMLAALMACTWRQTGYWQDRKTLWEHALACDPKNVTAHYLLGQALRDMTWAVRWRNFGRPWSWVQTSGTSIARSAHRYTRPWATSRCERRRSRLCRGRNGSSHIAARTADVAEAIAHYERALELDPDFPQPT